LILGVFGALTLPFTAFVDAPNIGGWALLAAFALMVVAKVVDKRRAR
jgi:hypothetical protein